MADRVFGAVRAAGTQIREKAGDQPITPGQLGMVGYAGVFEKGVPGTLIGPMTNPALLKKKLGSFIPDSLAPDAAQDYLELANGSGGILAVRVTDGNERKAGPAFAFDNATRTYNLFCRRLARTILGRVTALSGGRWGGYQKDYTDETVLLADIAETTITTGLVKFKKDEWKGGYVELDGVPNTRYPILSNTAAGVITVGSDLTMASDLAAGADPTNQRYYLVLDDDVTSRLSIEIRDGEEKPTEEFGIFVYEDGNLANQWPNLSIEPTSKRYWVDIINNDPSNDEIFVEDVFTGTRVATIRPANVYGEVSTVTATVLTAVIHNFSINSPGGGDPTFALGTTTDAFKAQTITVTMTSPTVGTAVSDLFGPLGTVTLGTLFNPVTGAGGANQNKWIPPFTITAGGNPLVATDTLVIVYKPFIADELIGGFVFADKVNFRLTRFRIVDNNHKTITVAPGSDMTTVSAAADHFLVEAPMRLIGGRDGIADLAASHYEQQAWDSDTSPFNRVRGKNYGLIKFATPGVTTTSVQKAGIAYAAAKNHQYREEIPSNILTEADADTYANDTIGRSDYAKVSFPSYGYVNDPLGGNEGKLKLVSLTGMIHGRESRIAADNEGYHKAEAGEDAILPRIQKLTTGEAILNEELLNPRGINVVKKVKGNFIMWGDRTLWLSSEWMFAHQRETMSYYEQVFLESFGFIIFAINDANGRSKVLASMMQFFLPEYSKGALDRDLSFPQACKIKIDKENNTAIVKAAGDMVCEVTLKLSDTVERLKIIMSKQGVFESAAP